MTAQNKPIQRRVYVAPVIRDEEVFERLAMAGPSTVCTGEPGVCGTPANPTGQVSEP
ncbi:MAG: hypothetical protein H7Z43_12090 [Clostridia bacterium]|nr:hypothetical protein [Deltaproteobacteria bacterium]